MVGSPRYERWPERQRGLRNYESGMRMGSGPGMCRPGRVSLRIEIPQAREQRCRSLEAVPEVALQAAAPKRPLKALVIGGFVRGLSMREIESLCERPGSEDSRSTVARICAELHERFEAF